MVPEWKRWFPQLTCSLPSFILSSNAFFLPMHSFFQCILSSNLFFLPMHSPFLFVRFFLTRVNQSKPSFILLVIGFFSREKWEQVTSNLFLFLSSFFLSLQCVWMCRKKEAFLVRHILLSFFTRDLKRRELFFLKRKKPQLITIRFFSCSFNPSFPSFFRPLSRNMTWIEISRRTNECGEVQTERERERESSFFLRQRVTL